MSLNIVPETPWEDWPMHQKIFGANALGDIITQQTFYRALFCGSDGEYLYSFEWVFRGCDDNDAAKKVRDFIERKVLWDDLEQWPLAEKPRQEIRTKYVECLELQRIVASLLMRPHEFLLTTKGEYCFVRNKDLLHRA